MSYLGDFQLGDFFDMKFTTVNASGVPTTLAGSPVVSAYVGNSTTEITAGITLSVDFDSRTGLHNVRVDPTDANGYAIRSNYQLVITTGTVDGNSVVGYVIGQFSVENRPPQGVVRAAAATGTLSTTQMTSNLAEATDDHYNGRRIVWTSGVLRDQATIITDYSGTGGLLTFVATTEAPSNGDTFIIV